MWIAYTSVFSPAHNRKRVFFGAPPGLGAAGETPGWLGPRWARRQQLVVQSVICSDGQRQAEAVLLDISLIQFGQSNFRSNK